MKKQIIAVGLFISVAPLLADTAALEEKLQEAIQAHQAAVALTEELQQLAEQQAKTAKNPKDVAIAKAVADIAAKTAEAQQAVVQTAHDAKVATIDKLNTQAAAAATKKEEIAKEPVKIQQIKAAAVQQKAAPNKNVDELEAPAKPVKK